MHDLHAGGRLAGAGIQEQLDGRATTRGGHVGGSALTKHRNMLTALITQNQNRLPESTRVHRLPRGSPCPECATMGYHFHQRAEGSLQPSLGGQQMALKCGRVIVVGLRGRQKAVHVDTALQSCTLRTCDKLENDESEACQQRAARQRAAQPAASRQPSYLIRPQYLNNILLSARHHPESRET